MRKAEVSAFLTIEGFHSWANAPDEVEFLRTKHRHVFHIRAWVEVNHDDRDIEFILLERAIRRHLYSNYGPTCDFGYRSCEMLAREILERFGAREVEVLEDGQGGARVYA